MIRGLDSSGDRPSAATADEARAAGVGLWNGYIATRPGVGLYSVWDRSDFDNARRCGGKPIAFCSGWDDPVALKVLAADWDVRLGLDVEDGIRSDGPWVQGWLDASGAGLYGNSSVHYNTGGRVAAFHVVAWYFARPPSCSEQQLTWPWWLPPLNKPSGWQSCGTHTEFGLSVDSGRFDDWFGGAQTGGVVAGGFTMDYSLKLALVGLFYSAVLGRGVGSQPEADQWAAQIGDHGENAWQVLQAISASDEAKAYATPAARIKALEDLVKRLQAAPVGNHTHPVTVSGASGQPA